MEDVGKAADVEFTWFPNLGATAGLKLPLKKRAYRQLVERLERRVPYYFDFVNIARLRINLQKEDPAASGAVAYEFYRIFRPDVFDASRRFGTADPILGGGKLVQSGEMQSGFKRLRQLGLLDWTIEAAVIKFAAEFSGNARQCAEWRLQQARPKGKDS